MSIPRITGRQARELLDGITPRPWRHSIESETGETAHYVRSGDEHLAVFTGNYSGASEDGELIAAAPELAETVAWLWSELEKLRDFADEDFRPSNYAEIATYDPLGAEKLRAAEETVRLVHRQYQRRIHGIFRATEEARP